MTKECRDTFNVTATVGPVLKRNAAEAQDNILPMQDVAPQNMAREDQNWRKVNFLNFTKGAHTSATVPTWIHLKYP